MQYSDSATEGERRQREYYASRASEYDARHLDAAEHAFALRIMLAAIRHYGLTSVLDVGAGTGRALEFLKREAPDLAVTGIEPSPELREAAYRKGLAADDLRAGDARRLPFGDAAFDLVCEFSVLHHLPQPARAVSEMLRVAKRAIFISDTNNFGHGRPGVRLLKQLIDAVHLWPLADWLKTGGRGYSESEGDGIAYSYSVFNDWSLIHRHCHQVHLVNLDGDGRNPYRTAPHVALLGVKHTERAGG